MADFAGEGSNAASRSIETLGSATVLCANKTGTLTENRMTVAALLLPEGVSRELPDRGNAPVTRFDELLRTGALASAPQPSDPMERAFHDAAVGPEPVGERELVYSYPLRPDLLAMMQETPGRCYLQRRARQRRSSRFAPRRRQAS